MSGQTQTTEPILVFGATGRQGSAVARHLVGSGFKVRAATRNPDQPAARALAAMNIEVVRADMDQRESVEAAMRSAYAVFSVQDFWQAGFEGEIRQGTTVAEVARTIGAQHFVYSSVASADDNTDLAHFESKWIVEQHIHQLGLPFTILRPVFFMENWEQARAQLEQGVLPQPLDADRSLQQIATDDIGMVAAGVFCNAGRWLGQVLELAGDELTMLETADEFGRALGRKVEYMRVPWDDFERATCREIRQMYEWFQHKGYQVDISALRNEFPKLKTFRQFLAESAWRRGQTPSASDIMASPS